MLVASQGEAPLGRGNFFMPKEGRKADIERRKR
nr:MAG TPA: hypothetical protein [Caudoviricetes sp.]